MEKQNGMSLGVQVCRPRTKRRLQQCWTWLQWLRRLSGKSSEWGPVATHAFAIHKYHALAHRAHVKNNGVISVWLVKVSLTWHWTDSGTEIWRQRLKCMYDVSKLSSVPFCGPTYLVPGGCPVILGRFPLNTAHALLRVNLLVLTFQSGLFESKCTWSALSVWAHYASGISFSQILRVIACTLWPQPLPCKSNVPVLRPCILHSWMPPFTSTSSPPLSCKR